MPGAVYTPHRLCGAAQLSPSFIAEFGSWRPCFRVLAKEGFWGVWRGVPRNKVPPERLWEPKHQGRRLLSSLSRCRGSPPPPQAGSGSHPAPRPRVAGAPRTPWGPCLPDPAVSRPHSPPPPPTPQNCHQQTCDPRAAADASPSSRGSRPAPRGPGLSGTAVGALSEGGWRLGEGSSAAGSGRL